MGSALIYVSVAALLFIVAFVMRRRIGAPILGLAAGSVLSSIWGGASAAWLFSRDPNADSLTLASLASAGLILLPAVLLMLRGRTYKSLLQKFVGAAVFTVVALAFLHTSLQGLAVPDGGLTAIGGFLDAQRSTVITAGLALAVFDLLAAGSSGSLGKKGKH